MSKASLLIIDEGIVKVVVGNTLKVCKVSELNLPHNVRFFERLFSDSKVFSVDSLSEVSASDFAKFMNQSVDEAVQDEPDEEVEVPTERQQKQADLKKRAIARKRMIEDDSEAPSELLLYRSTAASHIIVDDLPVGDTIRGLEGVKRMLSIAPNKAINLSVLDPEAVRKSVILRQLIREGILVPCTPKEAAEIEAAADAKARGEDMQRMDCLSPIIASDKPGSARQYAESLNSGKGSSFASMIQEDAEPYDVEDDAPRMSGAGNNGQMSLDDLMKLAGADDDGPSIEDNNVEEIMPRRQLAQRPAVPATEKDGRPTKRIGIKR